jgi:hypothetical protein
MAAGESNRMHCGKEVRPMDCKERARFPCVANVHRLMLI